MIVYIRMFFSTFDNSTTGFDSLPSQGILVVCGLRASALVPLGPVLAEDAILWQLFYGINYKNRIWQKEENKTTPKKNSEMTESDTSPARAPG